MSDRGGGSSDLGEETGDRLHASSTDRLRPTMSRPDTIARLKVVPLFQNCSARQLRRIANLGRESTFEAGRSLCEEGKFSKEFFVILEGHAEVRRGGRKRGTLGSGDYFGEIALLRSSLIDRSPRTSAADTARQNRS
jgi:CRP-like cAMP-binding protein